MLTTSMNPTNLALKCFLPPLNSPLYITKPSSFSSVITHHYHHHRSNRHRFLFNPKSKLAITRASSDGDATTSPALTRSSHSSEESYVALLIRMLGLDYDPLDREQAIVSLWKYSEGGNRCIDGIMQFSGCINLIVNLLRSDSSSACEAAAGLLRTISSVNQYRSAVAECGAVEEITAQLTASSLTPEVKEQCLCTLWNLSVDENLSRKMANSELLLALIEFLNDEEMKVKEASGGVLANLALVHSNHKIMAESGVIPKLAKVLKADPEGSKVIRRVAKNALLELAKDDFYKILVMEEGLVLVPLVGAEAYKSFKPVSHSWPSFPDGTELERNSPTPSKYGASELLLGLNIQGKSFDLEEAKINAIVGRTQQHFLARIGAIELEEGKKPQPLSSTNQGYTLLPWIDGVARLVIILELEDVSAISRAAYAVADSAINEHMRMSFMVAGTVKHLVRLLNHNDEAVKLSACYALERLSISNDVCNLVEAEGAVYPIVNLLKEKEVTDGLMEKTVNILARILDPGKEMKMKFYNGPVNGSKQSVNGSKQSLSRTRSPDATKESGAKPDDLKESKSNTREDVLDSSLISRLVKIMKTYPYLQTKIASIFEYISTIESSIDILISSDIESGLDAVFHPRFIHDIQDDTELSALEAAETGLAISAASRLLTKLLDFEQFRQSINSTHLIQALRKILKSDIPLQYKDWVAASLIKLESSLRSQSNPDSPINKEVTLYETIPRLIRQIQNSFSVEEQEAAIVELKGVISTGVMDFTRAVADQGGIFPLVKLIEEGSATVVEAGLVVLFNLSMDSENHSAIIAAGGVNALRRIVLSQGPQWSLALRLLRSLPTN